MTKYIQDSIRNNLRSIIKELSVPQANAIKEITRGLFTAGKPILNHLAQDKTKSIKKQAEKYAHHLGNVPLKNKIDNYAFNKAKNTVRRTTIIAYDLTDISKECSSKIEKISRVFDGSKRKSTNGFQLHGVGINNILTKLEIHDSDKKTLNQTREEIVRNISNKLNNKGIWVFDRGNDSKNFFNFLRHKQKVDFICRLREKRILVDAKTGEIFNLKNKRPGKYEVFLMNNNNNQVDARETFSLIIHKHPKNKEPIRLISSLKIDKYSELQFLNIYLERWGVENIFKRVKTKFELESIRVLKFQRFENLVSLIQFAVIVSTLTFYKVQQSTNSLITAILMFYKVFIKHKNLTFNIDSFISFMKSSLQPLIIKKPPGNLQLKLFSKHQMEKLGVI